MELRINKQKSLLVIKLVVTILLLYLLTHKIDFTTILNSLTSLNMPLFTVALLLVIPNVFFHYLSWNYVLRIAGVSVQKTRIVESVFIGFSFAFITPGGIGESGRGIYFTERNRFHMIGLSFIDKFFSLMVTLILGLIAASFYFYSLYSIPSVLLCAFIIFICCSPKRIGKIILTVIPYIPLYKEELGAFIEKLKSFNTLKAGNLLVINILTHTTFFLQFYILLQSYAASIHFTQAIGVIALISMIKAVIPITIGDLGVREGLAIYFLSSSPFSIPSEIAFSASFLLFCINIALPSLIGLIFLPKLTFRS